MPREKENIVQHICEQRCENQPSLLLEKLVTHVPNLKSVKEHELIVRLLEKCWP